MFDPIIDFGGNTSRLTGAACLTRRVVATYTADASGNGGTISIPNINGSLLAVATTAPCVVCVEDIDGIDMMGLVSLAGAELDSRVTFANPAPIVGGITLKVTAAPMSATNKVVLYVE